MRPRFLLVATLAIAAAWLFGQFGLHAQTCKLKSNGMCANPGAVCSPIDNSDKSSASKGNCTTKIGAHPIGNTCECKGKLDAPPPPPDHVWDLVPSKFGLDPNGFLRMPNWKWASPGPPNGAGFDVCDFCPCTVGTWGLNAPDHQEPLWLGAESCTHGSHTVSPPLHENSNNLCSGGPAQKVGKDASGVGYHMNWEPVEYEGPLQWEDHSTWLVGQSSGDNEYQLNILRPELFLVTKGREGKGVHLEFDSTETVDQWDGTGTWWDHPFHHDWVDGLSDNSAISHALGTPFAVVVGMLGLDVAHTDHHAELHPVYAMFIRDPPGAPTPPAHEVRWSFFVRNWGNEGSCGHDQEQLWVDHIDVQLPDRRLGSVINVRPYRHGQDQGACPQEWFIDQNGVLRFPMASPDMKCGWVGEVTMVRSPFRVLPGSIVSVPAAIEEEQEVGPQTAKIRKLSASDRRQLNKQISDLLNVSRNQPTFGEKIPVKQISPLPPAVRPKVTNTVVKVAADPAWRQQEERKQRLIEEFLKAHGVE